MFNKLGDALLVDVLQEASMYFTLTNMAFEKEERCLESVAFVAGTSLDVMIDYYHLDKDADNLREIFFKRFDKDGLMA